MKDTHINIIQSMMWSLESDIPTLSSNSFSSFAALICFLVLCQEFFFHSSLSLDPLKGNLEQNVRVLSRDLQDHQSKFEPPPSDLVDRKVRRFYNLTPSGSGQKRGRDCCDFEIRQKGQREVTKAEEKLVSLLSLSNRAD